MMGGVFLILGGFFEELDSIAYHVYIEEIFELLAYVFILLAALLA